MSIQYLAAKKAAEILKAAGFEAYIIGGAVRDLLLGINPKDFDLATNAKPEEVTNLDGFVRSKYKDTAQAFGVTRVIVDILDDKQKKHQVEIEIATYRQDIEAHLGRRETKIKFASLQDDIQRRDFSINALALDPESNQVIDEVGGIDDLKNKTIRFIGNPEERIQEDPLRILRGIRLRNQLGFEYEEQAKNAIEQAVKRGKIADIAPDRIKTELTRLLMHSSRKQGLEDLDSFGILQELIPEVSALKGVEQPEEIHAEGDVFTHTLLAMHYLPDISSPRLAWATLLHDIGKAPTQVPAKETGDRIRFSGHHSAGSTMAKKILRRMRFSKRFSAEVAWMVHYHLGIDDLPNMRPRRAENIMHHPAFSDLLELHRADAHAAWSRLPDGSIDNSAATFPEIEAIWRAYQDAKHKHPPSLKRDLGIDGEWLMKETGIDKGPLLGEALISLESAYLEHEIDDKRSAKKFIDQWLDRNKH